MFINFFIIYVGIKERSFRVIEYFLFEFNFLLGRNVFWRLVRILKELEEFFWVVISFIFFLNFRSSIFIYFIYFLFVNFFL